MAICSRLYKASPLLYEGTKHLRSRHTTEDPDCLLFSETQYICDASRQSKVRSHSSAQYENKKLAKQEDVVQSDRRSRRPSSMQRGL